MRTGNPTLSDAVFLDAAPDRGASADARYMTIEGTVNKTALLLSITVGVALATIIGLKMTGADVAVGDEVVRVAQPGMMWGLTILGLVGGLISFVVIMFNKKMVSLAAPAYALFEGLFLGAITLQFETFFPGIGIQAAGLTFGVLFGLLSAYRSGMIKATENFKLGVVAATMGIMMVYVVSIVMNLFGASMPMIHDNGIMGIGFSLFVVVIAALNLVLDFDFIERGAESRAPKYMEWYGAFSLLVTLVWLYVEILRLLSKLQSRD